MKNKYFIVQYTSGKEWEVRKGITIIEAKKRTEAIMIFKKQIQDRRITNIKMLRQTTSRVIYNKDVSLL